MIDSITAGGKVDAPKTRVVLGDYRRRPRHLRCCWGVGLTALQTMAVRPASPFRRSSCWWPAMPSSRALMSEPKRSNPMLIEVKNGQHVALVFFIALTLIRSTPSAPMASWARSGWDLRLELTRCCPGRRPAHGGLDSSAVHSDADWHQAGRQPAGRPAAAKPCPKVLRCRRALNDIVSIIGNITPLRGALIAHPKKSSIWRSGRPQIRLHMPNKGSRMVRYRGVGNLRSG